MMIDLFNVYLPIAQQGVNLLVLLVIGLFTGVLSGAFGLGGGLISGPILIACGIEPKIVIASAANQMTAASFSSYLGYTRRNRVDYKLGAIMLLGGIPGSVFGVYLFLLLSETGIFDIIVSVIFIVILGTVGVITMIDAIYCLYKIYKHTRDWQMDHDRSLRRFFRLNLPFRVNLKSSRTDVSIIPPILVGFIAGILTSLTGIGGSLIIIPALLYLIGVSHVFTAGTCNLQIIFTSILSAVLHSIINHSIDIILSSFLICGTVLGAQIGVRIAANTRPEYLRPFLALIILSIGSFVMYGLYSTPRLNYSVEFLR